MELLLRATERHLAEAAVVAHHLLMEHLLLEAVTGDSEVVVVHPRITEPRRPEVVVVADLAVVGARLRPMVHHHPEEVEDLAVEHLRPATEHRVPEEVVADSVVVDLEAVVHPRVTEPQVPVEEAEADSVVVVHPPATEHRPSAEEAVEDLAVVRPHRATELHLPVGEAEADSAAVVHPPATEHLLPVVVSAEAQASAAVHLRLATEHHRSEVVVDVPLRATEPHPLEAMAVDLAVVRPRRATEHRPPAAVAAG